MLVPSCFHGLIKDVKRECAKVARKLLAGKTLDEAVAAYEMLDTRNFPNSVLQLRYSHQVLCKSDDFHFPYLMKSIKDLLYKKYEHTPNSWDIINDKKHEVFVCLLEKDWSALCLAEVQNAVFWYHKERWIPYITAMLKHWNIYVEMGDVFDSNVEIPDEVLRRPLPGMDLKKLLDDYGVFDVDISRLP